MAGDLPDYYFRIRENGAVLFKVDTENRQRRCSAPFEPTVKRVAHDLGADGLQVEIRKSLVERIGKVRQRVDQGAVKVEDAVRARPEQRGSRTQRSNLGPASR